jgi:GT2 family glycosyltransferase
MKLTVICVFHNQKDHIESTLTALYEAEGLPFEVIIVEDGSTDNGRDIIHSVYQYYEHEKTFIFEHDEQIGKGNCLNEAVLEATGDIIWLVDRIDKLHVDSLKKNIELFEKSSSLCLLMDDAFLPDDIESWIEIINNGHLHRNEHFLWKWKQVPKKQRFFNPYQSDFHAIEAAIRIADRDKMMLGSSCFESKTASGRMAGVSANRAEVLMSLFRERKLSVEQTDLLMSQLKLKEKKLSVDTAHRSVEDLLDEARAYLREGYNIDALEIVNKLLEKSPDNIEVLSFKVQVLNRLNRYVEASELKHKMQSQFGISLQIPKAGQRRPIDTTFSKEELSETNGLEMPKLRPSIKDHLKIGLLLTKPPELSDAEKEHPISDEEAEVVLELSTTRDEVFEEEIDIPTVDAEIEPEDTFEDDGAVSESVSDLTKDELSNELDLDPDDLDLEYDFPEPVPVQGTEPSDETVELEEEQAVVEDTFDNQVDDPEVTDVEHGLEEEDDLDFISAETVLSPPDDASVERPLVTIVVITASDRKNILERCFHSIAEYSNFNHIEIICVDNASLDDTHEYLDDLQHSDQINFRAITNRENKGFAYAANQGIDAANGVYICLMHNDVFLNDDLIGSMTDIMESRKDLAMLGAMMSFSNNEKQLSDGVGLVDEIENVDYLDSALLFMRASNKLKFDTNYGLAWFEDKDICNQAKAQGLHLGLAKGLYVDHLGMTTTNDIGVEMDSKSYWVNKAYYHQKWGEVPKSHAYLSEDPVQELIAIGTFINPWQPEATLMDRARQLLNSENRTLIQQTSWDYESIAGIMQILMVIESRELLRHLEDRLTAFELEEPLAYRLIQYYFDRSIYSRCLYYLSELPDEKLSFRLRILRLRIAVNEKKLDLAIPMVSELFGFSPSNPELMRISAELHKYESNYDEAEKLIQLAKQIDPISM